MSGVNEVRVSRLQPDMINPSVVNQYVGIIQRDMLAHLGTASLEQTMDMAWGNMTPEAKLEQMQDEAASKDTAQRYLADYPENDGSIGKAVAAAKIGVEHYGDRQDLGLLQWNMSRVVGRLGWLNPTTAQVFNYGGSLDSRFLGRNPEDEDNRLFRQVIRTAQADLPPEIVKLSAFVDTRDAALASRMESVDPSSYRRGRKVVDITLGNTRRSYERHTVQLEHDVLPDVG